MGLFLPLFLFLLFISPARAEDDPGANACWEKGDECAVALCLTERLAALDKEMDAAYKDALAHALTLDDMAVPVKGAKAPLKSGPLLKAGQKQFTAYRETECGRQHALMDQDNPDGTGGLMCRIGMTVQRIADLQK